MAASRKGHTEAIKLLLTAPDINVNLADKVSLYPLPLLPSNSLCILNPPFILSHLLSASLQGDGKTALIVASEYGHTGAIKALLTAPGINVNHEDVSLYLLTPLHLRAVNGSKAHLPHLISPKLTLAMMTYLSPTCKMYPSTMKNKSKCFLF